LRGRPLSSHPDPRVCPLRGRTLGYDRKPLRGKKPFQNSVDQAACLIESLGNKPLTLAA